MSKPALLLLISEDWYFWTHRRSIAFAALKQGYEVTLVTRVHELQSEIEDAGIKLIPSLMKRSGINPIYELQTIIELIKIYYQEQPDIVHHVAIKSILYGTLAAKIAGINGIVNALGGLGHIFSATDWRMKLVKIIYIFLLRLAFSGKENRLILQNPDDKQIIVENRICPSSKIELIRGSGVNLDQFIFTEEPEGIPLIMYAGRLLWSKGVGDFVRSAEILIKREVNFKAVLVGRPDPENPESIQENSLKQWEREGLIEWWGYKEDMAEVLAKSILIVLPARFREGLPKILIEAAAVGRPIIATDIPGCREVVRQNWNGLLVPVGDPEALADAIASLLADKNLRQSMGKNSRSLVEKEFSEKLIIKQTFSVYEDLLS